MGSHALCIRARLPTAFLELHIEQGPRPRARRGAARCRRRVSAGARRARVRRPRRPRGTTPMDGRRDALVEAAAAILRIRDAAPAIPGAVATVGQIDAEPGGVNVIPGKARISVDVRAIESERPRRACRRDRLEPAQRARHPPSSAPSAASAPRRDRRARPSWTRRARVGRGPRRGDPRGGRRRRGNALRAQPERRCQPLT